MRYLALSLTLAPFSYTHLDVYKRQAWHYARLEDFSLDLCRYLKEGEICPGQGRYLFDYTDWSLHDLQTGQEAGFGSALPVLPRWEA